MWKRRTSVIYATKLICIENVPFIIPVKKQSTLEPLSDNIGNSTMITPQRYINKLDLDCMVAGLSIIYIIS